MGQSIMNIEQMKVADIKPYSKNAKMHDKVQIDNVAESIRQFGFAQPLVVDKDNNLIIGHCRLIASKKLHLRTVPVVRMTELTEEQVNKLRLLDNKLNESDWDFNLLIDEVAQLDFDGFDLDWGIELDDGTTPAEVVEDEIPAEIETRCKAGDLWQLGRHRLICGDSTNEADIERLLAHHKADIVLQDPPYGVSVVNSEGTVIGYGKKHLAKRGNYAPIKGDDTTETAELNFQIISKLSKKQIIFGGNYFTQFLPFSDSWLIWDKRGESGMKNNFADGEMAWCSFHTPVRIYHQLWNGMIREGEHDKRVHPTQKPVKMLGEMLKDFSEENDTVLDCFGGSGSTLMACEQLNRQCYICELEPYYCDVIIARWEKLTGQKAVIING